MRNEDSEESLSSWSFLSSILAREIFSLFSFPHHSQESDLKSTLSRNTAAQCGVGSESLSYREDHRIWSDNSYCPLERVWEQRGTKQQTKFEKEASRRQTHPVTTKRGRNWWQNTHREDSNQHKEHSYHDRPEESPLAKEHFSNPKVHIWNLRKSPTKRITFAQFNRRPKMEQKHTTSWRAWTGFHATPVALVLLWELSLKQNQNVNMKGSANFCIFCPNVSPLPRRSRAGANR